MSGDVAQVEGVFLSVREIQTKGLFDFTALPTELRLKIYENLFPKGEKITVPHEASDSIHPHIPAAILQTCKKINEEATSYLYSRNTFIIYLPLLKSPSWASFVHHFRWTTISLIPTINWVNSITPPSPPASMDIFNPFTRSIFSCSGRDILERFTPSDMMYAPMGPDERMVLSIANWVSVNVMRVEMNQIQRELETMMAPNAAATFVAPPQGGQGN